MLKFTACSSVQIRVSSIVVVTPSRSGISIILAATLAREKESREAEEKEDESTRTKRKRGTLGGRRNMQSRAQVSSSSLTFDAGGILRFCIQGTEAPPPPASPLVAIRSFPLLSVAQRPAVLDPLAPLFYSLSLSLSLFCSLPRSLSRPPLRFGIWRRSSPALEADLLRYARDVTERVSSSGGTRCQLRIVQARSRITNR